MSRKMIYLCSLVGFFFMWGLFGFVAAAPRTESHLQATAAPIETTSVVPGATQAPGIPVTAESEPVWIEIVGFYGMIGLAALCLILAMLSWANRSTTLYPKRNEHSSEESHKH